MFPIVLLSLNVEHRFHRDAFLFLSSIAHITIREPSVQRFHYLLFKNESITLLSLRLHSLKDMSLRIPSLIFSRNNDTSLTAQTKQRAMRKLFDELQFLIEC